MTCQYCGKEFEHKSTNQKYCCAQCYHESHRTNRVCAICGARLNFNQQKYCSNNCRHIGHHGHRTSFNISELSPKEAIDRRTTIRKRAVERAIKWQRENKVKVYASQAALKNKDILTVLYECHCDHPKKHNHHFDYSRPLEVIKLCPACHAAEHKRLRSLTDKSVDDSSKPESLDIQPEAICGS